MSRFFDMTLFFNLHITPHLDKEISDKIKKVLKRVSGKDWQQESQSDQFLVVLRDVHEICDPGYPLDAEIIKVATSTLGAHVGIKRKGYRGRPYWHHQMLVVAIGWICGFSKEQIFTLFLHDDIEDLPKNWSEQTGAEVTKEFAYSRCVDIAGTQVADNVVELSNPENMAPGTKHAVQCDKMTKIKPKNKQCKSADRCGNLLDCVRDLAKGHGKAKRLANEIIKAHELISAAGDDITPQIWSAFACAAQRIYDEMGFKDIAFLDPI